MGPLHAKLLEIRRPTRTRQETTLQDLAQNWRHVSAAEAATKRTLSFRGRTDSTSPQDRHISIPDDIGRFQHLTSLTLMHFHIDEIPWTVIYLKELKCLNLSFNSIRTLPKYISFLLSLEQLNLDSNQLTGVPMFVFMMPKLNVLSVEDNLCYCPTSPLDRIRASVSSGEIKNLWADSKAYYCDFSDLENCTEVKSLVDLSVERILSSNVDYLSPKFVAPRLKSYLLEKTEQEYGNTIQVAKCSACRTYFSNPFFLECHICKALTNPSSRLCSASTSHST